MDRKQRETTFIPCGDAFEKMDEIGGIELAKEEPEQERQQEENPEVND